MGLPVKNAVDVPKAGEVHPGKRILVGEQGCGIVESVPDGKKSQGPERVIVECADAQFLFQGTFEHAKR